LYARSSKVPPVVMSGGYLVAEQTNPLMELGVKLDLAVRHETTQIIRGGAYYPEPNTLTLVEFGKDTVEENFTEGTLIYESPKEMPILMKKIALSRKLNPQNDFRFEKLAAIITTCPTRMIREFTAAQNHKGQIISWKLADFKKMRGINQSHFKSRSWAKNVLDSLKIPQSISLIISGQSITLIDKKIISDLLISLISRIFKAFDSIFIAKLAAKKNPSSSFRVELVNLMQKYEKIKKELLPTSHEYDKPSKSKKPMTPERKAKKENSVIIWKYIDKIIDLQECSMMVNQLLDYPKTNSISANNILTAARQSHLAVIKILRNSLSTNYTELFLNSLIMLHNDFSDDPVNQFDGELSDITLHPAYSVLLSVECLDNKNVTLGQFTQMKERTLSFFGALPLHFAAIKGDVALAKWLIEKRTHSRVGWIGDINKPSAFGILPVHCAIRYCADHSENYEIIKLLTNEGTLNEEISSDGNDTTLTAFTMAMIELKNPLPLLEYYVQTYGDKISIYEEGINFDVIFISAIRRNFAALADFLSDYVSNIETVLTDEIEFMSPAVDKDLIQRALNVDVDLEEIIGGMGEFERMDFENNLRHAMKWNSEESDKEILESEYSEPPDEEALEDNCEDQTEPNPFRM
ncbi:MAG: ankyrin repeat domain-containing protein, partial [Pseudomonadota bacterium]|nr:ankyrin repeat domain-containing protein [Pseudomonadota bacterium]